MRISLPAVSFLLLAGVSVSSCTFISQSQRMRGTMVVKNSLLEVALQRHVTYLSQNCVPRNGAHPENMRTAASYLAQEFRVSGGRVSEQTYISGGRTYRNVRCVFPGQEKTRIIIGANYDAYGVSPGADDNASGVAALIELAKKIKGMRHRYTIELVAYANGQKPWFKTEAVGSMHHARMLKKNGMDVKGAIVLRSIGFFSDREKSQTYPNLILSLSYPDKGDFIAVLGNISAIPLSRQVQSALLEQMPVARLNLPDITGALDHADQYSYWKYDIPAILVTDTGVYRNANNQQSTDTASTLDFGRMSRVVQGLFKAVSALDQQK